METLVLALVDSTVIHPAHTPALNQGNSDSHSNDPATALPPHQHLTAEQINHTIVFYSDLPRSDEEN